MDCLIAIWNWFASLRVGRFTKEARATPPTSYLCTVKAAIPVLGAISTQGEGASYLVARAAASESMLRMLKCASEIARTGSV